MDSLGSSPGATTDLQIYAGRYTQMFEDPGFALFVPYDPSLANGSLNLFMELGSCHQVLNHKYNGGCTSLMNVPFLHSRTPSGIW